jgi:hypothetical protein
VALALYGAAFYVPDLSPRVWLACASWGVFTGFLALMLSIRALPFMDGSGRE